MVLRWAGQWRSGEALITRDRTEFAGLDRRKRKFCEKSEETYSLKDMGYNYLGWDFAIFLQDFSSLWRDFGRFIYVPWNWTIARLYVISHEACSA